MHTRIQDLSVMNNGFVSVNMRYSGFHVSLIFLLKSCKFPEVYFYSYCPVSLSRFGQWFDAGVYSADQREEGSRQMVNSSIFCIFTWRPLFHKFNLLV